jgi:hypothetical protein
VEDGVEVAVELLLAVGRDQRIAVAEDLVGGPPEDALGRRVPDPDGEVGIQPDDRQRGSADQGGQDRVSRDQRSV